MRLRIKLQRRRNDGARIAAIAAIVAGAACFLAPSGQPSVVPPGIWGGDHVAMTVAAAATHIEFDCAHGDLAGMLTTDEQGQFSIVGTFVREHGGPIRQGEAPDSHPASYVGAVSARTMMLTVRLTDSSDTIGTFALSLGSAGHVVKCL